MKDQSAGHPVSGLGLIAAERQRQIEEEGFAPSVDDDYEDQELLEAAVCYAYARPDAPPSLRWPWPGTWWKPSEDCLRNLAKAGALIAAEMDRIIRRDLAEQKLDATKPV
jgi:hypothetical protein